MIANKYEEILGRVLNMLDNSEYRKVQELLVKGEEENDKNIIAVYGLLHIYGIGISHDIERGIEKIDKAITLGCSDVANDLGKLYIYNDIGFPINRNKALEYYLKGAEMENSESYARVGIYYLDAEGNLRDDKKAFEYSKKAAEMGQPIGMYNTGICYENGTGIQRNLNNAVYWYKKYLDYEPEDADAMYRIASCLTDFFDVFDIQPTQEMFKEAYYYATKAVEKHHIRAHIILGRFYEMGIIVRQDFQKSYDCMKFAANNGDEMAAELLKRYRKNIFGKRYLIR